MNLLEDSRNEIGSNPPNTSLHLEIRLHKSLKSDSFHVDPTWIQSDFWIGYFGYFKVQKKSTLT